jgi:hypothetical protein
MRAAANVVSSIFHPLFVPIYGLVLLMYLPSTPESFLIQDSMYHSPESIKQIILFLFGIFGVIAPGVSLLLFKYNKTISSLSLDIQHERKVPIFMMAIYMGILFFFLTFQVPDYAVPNITRGISLGATLGIIIAGVLNRYTKISLHLLGMGMLTGAVFMYYTEQYDFPTFVLPSIFVLSGAVATARLYLNAHSYFELILGYLIGLISLVGSIFLFNFVFR